MSTEILK